MCIPNLLLPYFFGFVENVGLILSGGFGIFLGLNILLEVINKTRGLRFYKTFLKLTCVYSILNLSISFVFIFIKITNMRINMETPTLLAGLIMTIFLCIIGFNRPVNENEIFIKTGGYM